MRDITSHTDRRTFLKATGAAGVAGLTGLAGCVGGIGGGGDLPTVTAAYVVAAGNKPSLFLVDSIREEVADNAGEEYELEVEAIGSTPDHVNAVAAGEIQVGMATIGSFPRALIQDAVPSGITAVAVDYEDGHEDYHSISTWTTEDSEVESAADLEGMNVGVNATGTGVHAIVVRELANHGLTEDDVEFVELAFPAIQSALDDGRIDAGIVPSTFSTIMRLDGGYRKLFDSHDAFGRSFPFTYLFTSNDFIDEETEALEAFLEDYASLVDYILDPDNRDQVVEDIADHFDAPYEIYDAFMYTEHDYYHPNPPELDADGLQFIVDELAEMDFLDEAVDVGPHVDNSYLP